MARITHLRLRTQLLIAILVVTPVLTAASLLILRHTVEAEVRKQLADGISKSVHAFETVQKQQDVQLTRSAELLVELPPLKAVMPTEHALTIQDSSTLYWRLAGSDLFALMGADAHVKAVHMAKGGWTPADVERHFQETLSRGVDSSWWYGNGHLYRVCLRPIVANQQDQELGILALGYEVNEAVAREIGHIAGSDIALTVGGDVIASTLPPQQEKLLEARLAAGAIDAAGASSRIALGSDDFEVASVPLEANLPLPARCYVMMSLSRSEEFLTRLNRILLALSLAAVVITALLIFYISRTVTRPVQDLLAAVRALAAGNYTYSIVPNGTAEVAELGEAFSGMRQQLLESQQHRIQAERMSALSRTASSISHDLRHYLAALLANAEFLYEAESLHLDKEDVYREIKIASDQMTELIDSFRELANDKAAIVAAPANLDDTIKRAIEAVRSRHPFRDRSVQLLTHGQMNGIFDSRKVERAFFNMLLNACEATSSQGHITIEITSTDEQFEVRVTDDGPGIPLAIRNTLFEPFVSAAKPNGTGLGLAIVGKIIHDHDGTVDVEKTSSLGTVFLIRMPRMRMKTSYEGVSATWA